MDYTIPYALNDKAIRDAFPAEVIDKHVECFRDFGVLCKTWFPGYFSAPYSKLHFKIIDFIQDVLEDQAKALSKGQFAGRKMCIIGNRGLAKSGFTLQGLGIRQLLYGHNKFLVFATNNATNSEVATETLRSHMTTDDMIYDFFGDIQARSIKATRSGNSVEDKKGSRMWQGSSLFNPSFTVLPRGTGQQIRGLNVRGQRPDLLLLDDIDKDDWLRNDEVRKKWHNEWFPGAVEFCVSQYELENIPWLISVSDTCKGSNCLVEKLSNDPDYETIRIALCDKKYKTLDPSFKSQERLDKEVARARKDGVIDVFAREAMSQPIASESAPFPPKWFEGIYYEEEIEFDRNNCVAMVIMDPARTLSSTADFTAILGVVFDFQNGLVYFDDLIQGRFEQWEMIDKMLDMVERMNAEYVGVDTHGLHVHIEPAIHEAMEFRRLYNTEYHKLDSVMGKGEFRGEDGGKVGRIKWGVQNWFRCNIVRMHRRCEQIQNELELLMSAGAKKDCADAAGYARQLLEKANLGFVARPQVKIDHGPGRERNARNRVSDVIEMQEQSGKWTAVHAMLEQAREMDPCHIR